jgi:hypothetical protein
MIGRVVTQSIVLLSSKGYVSETPRCQSGRLDCCQGTCDFLLPLTQLIVHNSQPFGYRCQCMIAARKEPDCGSSKTK